MIRPERVWYVAYGSNVNEKRFRRYLEGDQDHVGARDPSPPAADLWTVAPLRLRFAGESKRWGGGVCFVDPDPSARAYVRAWNVTAEQFEDVFAQENRRPIGEPFPWDEVAAGHATIGSSWYARVVHLDVAAAGADLALTFTWSTPLASNAPAAAYRGTIATGLADHPDLCPTTIDDYLNAATVDTGHPMM